jgi:UDP-N-acetylmuramoyl-tripeptide--D-alanyl-D-alanine ligase
MKRLLEIARPHIGVVTAIGAVPSHVEFFAGPEAVVREKGKLIAALPATGFAILNHDEREIHAMKEGTRAHAITFGSAEDADVRITNTETILRDGMPETAFKITYGGSLVPVRLKGVMGMPHAYAAVTAAAVALAFGMHLVKIAEALGEYTAPNGRMKVIHGVKGSTVLDDTYNAAPSSVRAALDALKTVRAKRKIAVLGDMLELGEYTIPAHKAIGEFAASHIKILITVGDKAKFIAEAAEKAGLSKKNIFVYSGLREASYELKRMIEHGDLVLVKGSQAVRMEKIVREIIEKPEDADELLVRQSPRWLDTPGMYDE